MFISEQYGWLANVSGEYWDAMQWYGMDAYDNAFLKSRDDDEYLANMVDADKMLIGL